MLIGIAPVTTNVALEGLAEDRIELHDVLLQANDVAVQCEHVVYAAILKVLDVNVLILGELDKITDLVLLRQLDYLHVVEGHIERVETHRLYVRLLESRVGIDIKKDDIDFAEGVTSLQRHEVVEGL